MTTQFKVGDRVRLTAEARRANVFGSKLHRQIFTVTRVTSAGTINWQGVYGVDPGGSFIDSDWLEHATALIDPSKQYRARDGREVRFYAPDCGGRFPIHGAVRAFDGKNWEVHKWTADGKHGVSGGDSPCDLIEVKRERDGWVNVYPADSTDSPFCVGPAHATRQIADSQSGAGERIACLHLKFTDGEGLVKACGEA